MGLKVNATRQRLAGLSKQTTAQWRAANPWDDVQAQRHRDGHIGFAARWDDEAALAHKLWRVVIVKPSSSASVCITPSMTPPYTTALSGL